MTRFLMALAALIVVFAVVSISTQSAYACDPNPCPKKRLAKQKKAEQPRELNRLAAGPNWPQMSGDDERLVLMLAADWRLLPTGSKRQYRQAV